jgi:hypothetical protein
MTHKAHLRMIETERALALLMHLRLTLSALHAVSMKDSYMEWRTYVRRVKNGNR